MGADFSALNEVDDTVREEILEELEPQTAADVDKSAVAMGGGSTSSRRAPSQGNGPMVSRRRLRGGEGTA
jgi:hypothetical protein